MELLETQADHFWSVDRTKEEGWASLLTVRKDMSIRQTSLIHERELERE